MAEQQARRTQDEEPQSSSRRREQEVEPAGVEPGSPERGVARLQAAAGNDAVSGMLQRLHGRPEGVEGVSGDQEVAPQLGHDPGVSRSIGDSIRQGAEQGALGAGPSGTQGLIRGVRQGIQQGGRPSIAESIVRGAEAAPQVGMPPAVRGGSGSVLAQRLRGLTVANLGQADSATRNLAAGLADAVGDAWSTWQSQATMVGVVVNGPTATGGQILAPPLRSLIKDRAAAIDPVAGVVLADAIGVAFDVFAATMAVPGLPLFRSFAAFPGPAAPPTPSTPIPLMDLAAATPAPLKDFSILEPTQRRACEAIVAAFDPAFTIWRATTTVSLTGTGPVPTFAPPYVPVGSVTGGIAMGPPGFMQ